MTQSTGDRAPARRRALLIELGYDNEPAGAWPITDRLIHHGYTVTHRKIPAGRSWVQTLRTLWATRDIAGHDLVAASEYSLGFGIALSARLRRARARVAVVGLNLSRRAFKTGIAAVDRAIDGVFGRVDAVVVHSTPEIHQFATLHGIDPARFTVVPWGFDLPDVTDAPDAVPEGVYVAIVGRNNRDFPTVARALDGTGVAGVFIGCRQPLPDVDATIIVRESLPFDQCLGVMRGALANVIALNDDTRGAGHITAVAGMLLARPHIFSAADVIADYLTDGVEGIAVPIGDHAALAAAIRQLRDDPALAERMGQAGRETALTRMSSRASADRVADVLLEDNVAR